MAHHRFWIVRSSDNFVRPRQDTRRNRQTDLLRSFEIYDEINLIDTLHRHIIGLSTAKNALDVFCRHAANLMKTHTVAGEATVGDMT